MTSLPSLFDPKQQGWMRAESVARIFAAVRKAGGEARFVGGCVRDALVGRAIGEIDLACNLPPEKTDAALKATGIKTAPTGIEHGTITAIVDHKGYEITSLRRDVETDGRRAKVAFTDDWQADAARRDFTINGLYADESGKIYDYFDGRADLAAGHVRFIGSAQDRIKEDVLRILRFFRFYAFFGKNEADAEGLKACSATAELLPQLSTERVWKETGKLLAAENPAPAWKLLIMYKILPHFLPGANNIARLENLIIAEKKFDLRGTALTRLAALLPEDEKIAAEVAKKLKMSNREAQTIGTLAVLPSRLKGKLDPVPLRRALYEYGAEDCREGALLCAAQDRALDFESISETVSGWNTPVFPLQGEDVLKLGLKPGPKVGEMLRAVEEWWIAQDFRPNRAECLGEAKRALI